MSESVLRTAVIGAGRLGTFHARCLESVPDAELIAVADPAEEAARRLAEERGVEAVADYRRLLSRIDAAIVAAPTDLHADIVATLLDGGVHVLVEKPITTTTEQADRLIELARRQDLVLQVGHVERFNPALAAADVASLGPRHFAARRTGSYTCRSIDVGVVLDLMIHDLDLILAHVTGELCEARARGARIVGPHEDVAFAELRFADGVTATLHASRVSRETVRQMQVWGTEGEALIDLAAHRSTRAAFGRSLYRRPPDVARMTDARKTRLRERFFLDHLPHETLQVEPLNAILQEQLDFARAIRDGGQPLVSGIDGRRALAAAEMILEQLRGNLWCPGRAVVDQSESSAAKSAA